VTPAIRKGEDESVLRFYTWRAWNDA